MSRQLQYNEHILRRDNLNIKDIIAFIFLGFLAFSPISTFIVMDLLHLPMSMPEIFVVIMLFFLPKEFKKHFTFNRIVFIKGFLLLFVLLIIGVAYARYSTKELLSTTRIYFDLLIFFSLSTTFRGPGFSAIYYICLGTIGGWLINALINLRTYFTLLDSENFVSLGNTLAIPLGLYAAINLGNKKFVIFLFLALTVCLVSLVRRPLFILFAAIFLLFLLGKIKRNIKKGLFFIILLLVFFLPILGTYLEEEYPIIYRRTFEKTTEFIHGESNADDDFRKENYVSFSICDNIFPRGFVTRNTKHPDGGLYIDYPFYEYFYTFGFFLFIILFVFLKKMKYLYRYSKKNKDSYSLLLFFMGIIFVLLSFIEGTFLSSTYIVPMTGFLIGQIRLFSKKH